MPVRHWLAVLVVALATSISFLPVLENGFMNLDDQENFIMNPDYRGLGWSNLRWMVSSRLTGHWIPVTWVTLGGDYLVWGMNPFGYHLTNLILHVLGATVFYFVAVRLLRAALHESDSPSIILGGAAAALFFAIHPLRVESVAWVTERRDVLSGLWFLLTILTYLKAVAGKAPRRWLVVSVLCYALAIGSKAIVITLPFVLLLLDVYPLRRLPGRVSDWFAATARGVWTEKIPYFVLAGFGAAMAIWAQQGLADSLATRALAERIAVASYGLTFYLWKTLDPSRISPIYEMPLAIDPSAPRFLLPGVFVILTTLVLLSVRRRWPAGLAIWISYAVLLAPVSGLTQSGIQMVASRYSYLSCLGLALFAGAGIAWLWRSSSSRTIGRVPAAISLAGVTIAFLGLGVLTWRQSGKWRDPETLWSYAVQVVPESTLAHRYLAFVSFNAGNVEKANEHLAKTVAREQNERGLAAMFRGENERAVSHFRQAVQADAEFREARMNLQRAVRNLAR